jgi:uncharacterized CHY-type Zn-finger protein
MADVTNIQDQKPGKIKAFGCISCGAKLTFKPGTQTMQCQYCGASNEIQDRAGTVEELDFSEYLRLLDAQAEKFEAATVKCGSCSAEQRLAANMAATHCAFCQAPISSPLYAKRLIKPKSVVPFGITRRQAEDSFRKWIEGRWLAPNDLKKYAQTDKGLAGIYIPYWTYDCATSTQYSGERGDSYTEYERVAVQDSQGRTVYEDRPVQKIRWTPVSGHVQLGHDDVLVLASESFNKQVNAPISGWGLSTLTPYQDEYVANYEVEAYQIGLADGFKVAKVDVDNAVVSAIHQDIGGDAQRVGRVNTTYSDVTFKHVLLPLWMSAYRYRDTTFRFMVNGQTGEVRGESPTSWIKVMLIVLAVIFVLILIFAMAGK